MKIKTNQNSTSSVPLKNITTLIAEAIKTADDSYFFENYTKQAEHVLRMLKKEGYVITKAAPSPKMIKAGINAINLGLVDAKELASRIFIDMYNSEKF